ncbi:MAG: hypothetical protein VX519_04675 [Myxococcota bacterium]|nr:hypothetical protein [Myxococcota bacterium]
MNQLLFLVALSGCASLVYELVWMRRFALLFGSGSLSITLTVATLFGGLGLGGLLAGRVEVRHPLRLYAVLEAFAALTVLALPQALEGLTPWVRETGTLGVQAAVLVLLLGPPAVALGATLPILAGGLKRSNDVALVYAFNTAGAVLGVCVLPWVLLPLLGVRGSEWAAAVLALCVAAVAWSIPWPAVAQERRVQAVPRLGLALVGAGVAGGVSMSLQVAWTRLTALLLGGSVHSFALVLAIFLFFVAVGAALGRRWHQPRHLVNALALLGVLALLGSWLYGQLPVLLGMGYGLLGEPGTQWVGGLLLVCAMAAAPLASGVVFTNAITQAGGNQLATSRVYGINTLAGVVGASATGLVLLPQFGVAGVVSLVAGLSFLAAAGLSMRVWPLLLGLPLIFFQPDWQGRLYAVGVYNRISEFSHITPAEIRKFAEEGWELLYYADGRSAAVAVGESTKTGNRWLSINGKVDASTGEDMPTQLLSGVLPLRMAEGSSRALLVGLASGVTAGAMLDEGVGSLEIVEIEPRVVEASRFFDSVSGAPLDDPRTTLVVEDARAVLSRAGASFDVIVSEPSNPWITGVSNLFTREYWEMGRARLASGGVFCQWVQLYGIEASELRSIVKTFSSVFPRVWMFETVEGADVLMLGGGRLVEDLPLLPTLGPEEVLQFAQGAQWNTDDRPRVELAAPRARNRATGLPNSRLMRQFKTDSQGTSVLK